MTTNTLAYLYGITSLQIGRLNNCTGVGNPPLDIQNVPMGGASLLISYLPSKLENLAMDDAARHVKVLEKVMDQAPVIPIQFGTVVESLPELKKLITFKKKEIKLELQRLDRKYEVGIKTYWRKELVIKELSERYHDQASLALRARIDREAAIEMGQRVEEIVDAWRETFEKKIHPHLEQFAEESFLGKPLSMEMLYNGAFLVNQTQEGLLKKRVEEIVDKYLKKIDFHYTTHLPPFNFVRLVLSWRNQR